MFRLLSTLPFFLFKGRFFPKFVNCHTIYNYFNLTYRIHIFLALESAYIKAEGLCFKNLKFSVTRLHSCSWKIFKKHFKKSIFLKIRFWPFESLKMVFGMFDLNKWIFLENWEAFLSYKMLLYWPIIFSNIIYICFLLIKNIIIWIFK